MTIKLDISITAPSWLDVLDLLRDIIVNLSSPKKESFVLQGSRLSCVVKVQEND